jgi:DNA segregation ATPase FtsK/SpoIIIE, S-DNA-T family
VGVTDQMRANIKFRICLRVETPDDSRELLRRSDAAFLPPTIPGRGYLQIGNENIELVQVAHTGGDYLGTQAVVNPNVIWLDRQHKVEQGKQEAPKLF